MRLVVMVCVASLPLVVWLVRKEAALRAEADAILRKDRPAREPVSGPVAVDDAGLPIYCRLCGEAEVPMSGGVCLACWADAGEPVSDEGATDD